ncbi:helix-turn-helix domain-containing protein [Polynucleobacter necessarius]|uniref:helix-turn-helix domain-containing protein n=1 Tax=Polynucleobacter necessarius TaxID=576610 RepID=UPI000E097C1B|nr:helix-turn-helix domain-containing protein [Polynucleobacter necessarius]HAT38685.1 hypothetical protein [Polynucleobacter sp.]
MGSPTKLPEIRKEAFTKARESLGLSTKNLSGMSCLSVRQIEQIENGETSSFYGAQVKFTAAKKVAGLLKLKPEEAFELSESAQAVKKSDTEAKNEQPIKAKEVQASQEIKTSAPVSPPLLPQEEPPKVSATKISEDYVDYSVKTKAPADPKKSIFILLAIAAAIICSVVNLRPLFFPEPVKEDLVIIQEVAPDAPPAEMKSATAVIVQPEPVVSTECPLADASALNYKPDAPKKTGDMVYFQSKTAQTICVVDAAGKTQNKTLEPGVGASVYGKPPFKVLTSGLNGVDMYFQGAKVRIGNTPNKTINLEAAEIIQPAAPVPASESQTR